MLDLVLLLLPCANISKYVVALKYYKIDINFESLFQEEQFATDFLNRDGLRELIGVISYSHGNTLAVCLRIFSISLSVYLTKALLVCFDGNAESHGTRSWLVEPLRVLHPQDSANSCIRTIPHKCMSTCDCHSQETG